MIYESACLKCGAYHTYIRKVADYLDTPVCCGEKTDKRLFTAPMMRADIAPWDAFVSPATGKTISSYAQRREDMKASGCRDYEGRKSEAENAARLKGYDDAKLDAQLDTTVRQAWANLSPQTKAAALAA